MLKQSDSKHAPGGVVRSDDERREQLNCIAHILSVIPYKKVPRPKVTLPQRETKHAYDDNASLKGRRFAERHF